MPDAAKPFIFVCGADDFLVNRLGKTRYDELTADVTDEFAREIISGFANNVGEVESAINRFRESVQTVSMFGGKRVVWFKDVNFLADSVTGRAESTLKLVDDLKELLATVDPAQVAIVITAAPIDRRRAFPKWCEKTADFSLVGGGDGEGGSEALGGVILAEARELGVTFGEGAAQLLLAKVGANTRLLIEETRKLATFAGGPDGKATVIEEAHVAELTANTAEGDFFEAAEAFFSGDLKWTLAALHHHFFTGGDARPIISAMQNRNRILIQVRALVDSGEARVGQRGLDGLPKAATAYGHHFIGVTEKSAYNLFSQNAWYVGKLAGSGKLPSLRRLIDNQQDFIRAFEEIVKRPNEQNEVLREMAVRCLSAA
ncbi:DNA polymerase III subunit delta [Rariglobus hedericola]|uniref:DNA polymerase III subunit delta n=1 Tax=Rariglobus hedericola TaxID=2597822 RepID=A0A556QJ87_9BACT|nr:DNA polymerase III subunit delta [Rariglobus hedericola]TSJ76692.1 DNA polymerase III subunit delta [Rariglobus hedericola]